jgi:hypothetical protein
VGWGVGEGWGVEGGRWREGGWEVLGWGGGGTESESLCAWYSLHAFCLPPNFGNALPPISQP